MGASDKTATVLCQPEPLRQLGGVADETAQALVVEVGRLETLRSSRNKGRISALAHGSHIPTLAKSLFPLLPRTNCEMDVSWEIEVQRTPKS